MSKFRSSLIKSIVLISLALLYHIYENGLTLPSPSFQSIFTVFMLFMIPLVNFFSSGSPSIPKPQLLLILNDLKKELIGVYPIIFSFATNMLTNIPDLPESKLKEVLNTETPIPSFIFKAQEKVSEKYGIPQNKLNSLIASLQNDPEIKALIDEININLDLAYMGKLPPDDLPLPESLTSDLVLKIFSEIYEKDKIVTYKHITLINSAGILAGSQEFTRKLEEMGGESESEKNLIFEKYELNKLEHGPLYNLLKAKNKWSDLDPGFKHSINSLESTQRTTLKQIMEGTLPADEAELLKSHHKISDPSS